MSLVAYSRFRMQDLKVVKKYTDMIRECGEEINVPKEVIEHAVSVMHHTLLFHFDLVYNHGHTNPYNFIHAIFLLASAEKGYVFPSKKFSRTFTSCFKLAYNIAERLSKAMGVPLDPPVRKIHQFYSKLFKLDEREMEIVWCTYEKIRGTTHEHIKYLSALFTYLKRCKGLTYDQIAEIAGTSSKTVERYVLRPKMYGISEVGICREKE